MLELQDLLNSAEGRAFLLENDIYTDDDSFLQLLSPPDDATLLRHSGADAGQKLVCTGQQVYLDYRQSVVGKLLALQKLDAQPEVATCLLWHDTDRSATDPLMNKFVWHMQGKQYPFKIAPPRTEEIEQRFVTLEAPLLEKAMTTLRNYLYQSGVENKNLAAERYDRLKALYLSGDGQTLSEFNLRVSHLLFEDYLGYQPRSVMLSTILNEESFIQAINACVNNLAAVVQVFNETGVELAHEKNINPQVRPLPQDYFPIHYSCPVDGRRLRLRYVIEGSDHFAIGEGKEGRVYRFHLGTNELSIDEIVQAGRWSPDVMLPVLLNRQVSGYVMGKSSALYGLMMRQVIKRVLGQQPAPFLVPSNNTPGDDEHPDSLLYRYLALDQQISD
jgi:hypothetical protein